MSKLKKVLLMCTAYVLVAALAIGGTIAYLTNTDSDVNVMTLGNVSIEQIEQEWNENKTELVDFTQNRPLYPYVGTLGWELPLTRSTDASAYRRFTMENVIDKYVSVKNTGKTDAFVRTFIALEMGDFTYDEFSKVGISINKYNGSEFQFPGTWDWNYDGVIEIEGKNYNVMVAVHQDAVAAGETTIPSLNQVYLSKDATNEDCEKLDGNDNGTYDILVLSQAVQADGFDDAVIALNTAFGDPAEGYNPWDGKTIEWPSFLPEPSTTSEALKTTLTEYNGASITNSISGIVFGKRSEYPNVVAQYEGVLVDETNEDSPFAYYVPNADSTYTVYMLSDSVIVLPEDCTGMFRDMTNMTTFDASNLDMSAVTVAQYMFRECTSLTTIKGAENWDTSNLTSTRGMFYNCTNLDGLDVSGWDVSNIAHAGWMFYNCQNISELDVSNWDTSSFTFTKSMFYNNTKLTELDVENWDMSDVTDTSYMFSYCTTLGDIDFSKWDVSNVQYFNNMFKYARAMTTLDLSTWDTSSAVDMNHMFANCGQLRYLDISGFDTSKVTTMAWMFYEIEAEKIYVGDKWSLESIANLDEGVYSHKIATAPLVGGQGTTCTQIMELDSKCVAENGARINATARYMIADGGTEKPGLLTYKAN